MAAKRKNNINLLPSEQFQSTIAGRILGWALSTFRIMVIVTEIIVMGAFLSRFWLDAKNSDLTEEVSILKSQVEAYAPVETEFRDIQKRISLLREIYSQNKISQHIVLISKSLPQDTKLISYSENNGSIQIKVSSITEKSMIQLIKNLKSTEMLTEITLNQIFSNTNDSIENSGLVNFGVSMKIKENK